jgi:hypothetical protein
MAMMFGDKWIKLWRHGGIFGPPTTVVVGGGPGRSGGFLDTRP